MPTHRLLPHALNGLLIAGAAALQASAAHLTAVQLQWLAGAPWLLLGVAALLGLHFHHGRVVWLVLLLSLAGAALAAGALDGSGLAARTAFLCVAVLLPANLTWLGLSPERGVLTPPGLVRCLVLLAQGVAAVWLVYLGQDALRPYIDQPWVAAPLHPPLLRFSAMALGVQAACLGAAAFFSVRRPDALRDGLPAVVAAACLALDAGTGRAAPFLAAAGLALVLGVLRHAWALAYRDELTGVPSRRALNNLLVRLGRHYTIAMIDIDHFKAFNDRYGHDAGDQVLRLAAQQIARVGGGGRAFRYGGEEFTVVFPRLALADALEHLEAVRAAVAGYPFVLRDTGRQRPRRGKGGGRTVNVTISIGAAERGDRHKSPDDVIQAADKALYRAKDKGRNQVSR